MTFWTFFSLIKYRRSSNVIALNKGPCGKRPICHLFLIRKMVMAFATCFLKLDLQPSFYHRQFGLSFHVNYKGTGEYIWDLRESHNNWVALKNECERWAKNSEENLEKDSPYVLLVFAWNQSPRSKAVVQLLNMEKGLVGFPTMTWFSKACSTDLEFHRGTLCPVTTMSYDWLDYELFLVILCNY